MVEKETESVLSNYISVKNIGDGIFGKVKLITDKKTKKNYALGRWIIVRGSWGVGDAILIEHMPGKKRAGHQNLAVV